MKYETSVTIIEKRTIDSSNRLSGLKSTLHLFGSMAIAYCLCTLAHELGHGVSYLLTGYHIRLIDIHPFGFNQCVELP